MRLRVTAPARLHFGLMQIDPTQPHCYGGLGLMLDAPALQIYLEESSSFAVTVSATNQTATSRRAIIEKVTESWRHCVRFFPEFNPDGYCLQVAQCPRLHSGLGTGTQLACSIASLVVAHESVRHTSNLPRRLTASQLWNDFHISSSEFPINHHGLPSAHDKLAEISGRGKRSHIGLEGFLKGGWIFDEGKCTKQSSMLEAQSCQRKVHHLSFPEQWQVLLVTSDGVEGLSGAQEQASFDRSERSGSSIPTQMYDLAIERILPAIQRGASEDFKQSIQAYNKLAGKLFTNNDAALPSNQFINDVSEVLYQHRAISFGQSSWGPTMWLVMTQEEIDSSTNDRLSSAFAKAGINGVSVSPVSVSCEGAYLDIYK